MLNFERTIKEKGNIGILEETDTIFCFQLILFPITSNRHDYRDYTGRYKILYRCPYLEDEKYPESFVNADILIIVPFEAIPYLDFCSECSSFCLKKILKKLHNCILFYLIIRLRLIKLI